MVEGKRISFVHLIAMIARDDVVFVRVTFSYAGDESFPDP